MYPGIWSSLCHLIRACALESSFQSHHPMRAQHGRHELYVTTQLARIWTPRVVFDRRRDHSITLVNYARLKPGSRLKKKEEEIADLKFN